MGALTDALNQHGIKPDAVTATSNKLETHTEESYALLQKRRVKRSAQPDVTYDKAGIAKPGASGRGITPLQLQAALADKPIPRKVRAKVVAAVNALLKEKGKPAVDTKALFGAVGRRAGKSKKAASK